MSDTRNAIIESTSAAVRALSNYVLVLGVCVVTSVTSSVCAQVPAAAPALDEQASKELATRYAALEALLTGSTFIGHFSDDAATNTKELREERYEISSAKKLPGGELWLIQARIKYGDKDVTIPIPLPIKWAGTTPVISLDKLTIPGLGTFDAKVVIAGNRYAGTWQHGEHGGHLFGRIERQPNETALEK